MPIMGEIQLLPDSRHELVPGMEICRVLNGMWQVSGAHGVINPEKAVAAMSRYVEAGFTTWDLADHYGPAEEFIGQFRRQWRRTHDEASLSTVQAFTKWVPMPGDMSRAVVEESIEHSLRRMDVVALDLLQFHWWDYDDLRYLDALARLADLREAETIRHLGLTNFDTQHLETILRKGIPIVSNQVQYSLIDRRPEVRMAPFCREHGVQLLTYGTVCGGLLSETYLNRPEPNSGALNTASLRKYKQMVDAWGDWELFQALLMTLKRVADRHGVSIANVAVRYILDKPAVAGVIVGVRLGVRDHVEDTARVFSLRLDSHDLEAIERVLAKANDLFASMGDCGDEYRR